MERGASSNVGQFHSSIALLFNVVSALPIDWRLLLPLWVKIKYPLTLSFLAALLIGYYSHEGRFCISKLIVFFPYFLIGYYLKSTNLYLAIKRVLSNKVFGVVFLVSFGLSIIFQDDSIQAWLWGDSSYAQMGHFQWYAFSIRLLVYAASLTTGLSFSGLDTGEQNHYYQNWRKNFVCVFTT